MFFPPTRERKIEMTTAELAVYLPSSIEMIKHKGFAFRH
ncbi:hypothetical protein SSYIS1_27830 [Serratia symbiotica]|uniref:Uncharacterized protein n=1 Tax=Serratia symbiotica TaxID=138074 RepID=A0A455VMT0_9GAMM|nr:hypothetical protein SSYIS1_27830 [Serratia symbiotica]